MSSNPEGNHEDHDGHSQYLQSSNGNGNANENLNNGSSQNGQNVNTNFWPPPQIIPYSYYSSAQPNPNSANHSSSSSNQNQNQPFHHQQFNPNNPPNASIHSSSSIPNAYPPPPPHWSPPPSHHQQFQHSDAHPAPYQDHQAPFPLPLGMRTVGGKNLPEEEEGEEADRNQPEEPWDSFALGGAPSRQTRRKRPEPPEDTGLGKTRCYWVLLSSSNSSTQVTPDLNFIYLDPVLQRHMGTEASAMLGTCFFDYVHPDEKERTLSDMSKIGEAKTLFGSVTRCRYSRVPHIRSLLGCAAPPQATDSHKYVFDEHYLAIDIVINWVGDGLALAFFHAVIDKSPEDNDEAKKTEWTNWCGTPAGFFSDDEIEKIWKQVLTLRKPCLLRGQAPEHVFQILEAGNDGDILFSWPPPRLFNNFISSADALDMSLGRTYGDGSYFADEFARLAQGVSCSPSERTPQGANTSCTRRFRAKHTLTSEGLLRSVESVLIPYGSLVLACFKTTFQQAMARSNYGGNNSLSPYGNQTTSIFPSNQFNTSPYHSAYHSLGQQQQQQHHHHPNLGNDQNPTGPTWIPLASGNSVGSTYNQHGRAYSSPDQQLRQLGGSHHHQHRSSLGSLGDLADATIAYADAPPGSGPAGLAPIGIEGSAGQASMRLANSHLIPSHHPHHHLPGMHFQNPNTSTTSSPLNGGMNDQKRKRPSEDGVGVDGKSSKSNRSIPTQKVASDGTLNGAIQSASSHPPVNQNGEKCCTGCGTINSPEWRKGPTGGKSLCNACGLRYSRAVSRAKKKAEADANGGVAPESSKKKKGN